MNIYRVDFASGSCGGNSGNVLVVADNCKDAEDAVMRKADSLFQWSCYRRITKITLVEGRVLVGSPVSFAVAQREAAATDE